VQVKLPSVNIARGTFRLSIVIALLVAAYFGVTGYMTVMDAEQKNWRLWTTLRCGERFLDQDMSAYRSPVRPEVFDIGTAGCSNGRFWATFEEIREAVARPDPSVYGRGFGEVFRYEMYGALFSAFGAFVLVNLAGFVLLGARGLFRWVRAGYR
jgi:hypothetical protein